MVADFQIGYDPCTCISRGELQLEFIAFNSMEVDIVGRSISVDQPITESNYANNNFLNLSDVNLGSYQPGTEVYQKMENLLDRYKQNLEKYNENLEDYNAWNNNIIRKGIGLASKYLTGGLANIVVGDSLVTWLYKQSSDTTTHLLHISETDTTKFDKKLTDVTKMALGDGFDFLTAQIFSPKPSKPTKPTIPVASYEESVYKGTISRVDSAETSSLYIPGTMSSGYGTASQNIPPFKYPAYNEVLGLVALLNTPSAQVSFKNRVDDAAWYYAGNYEGDECHWEQNFILENNISLRITDNIDLAFNPALDFDFSKTKTYVMVEIEIQNEAWASDYWGSYYPKVQFGSNLHLSNAFLEDGSTRILNSIYQSDWIDLQSLNQMVFALNDLDSLTNIETGYFDGSLCSYYSFPSTFEVKSHINSIKLKVMNDMYFNQIGSNEVPINTTQVFSYILYNYENSINNLENYYGWPNSPPAGIFDQYTPGMVTIGDETITPAHPAVTSYIPNPDNKIYINAQKVFINGGLNVQPYDLEINALDEIRIAPGVIIEPNVHLKIKKDFYNTPIFEYANNTFIHNFCTDQNQYHANVASKSVNHHIRDKNEFSQASNNGINFEKNFIFIHPNPANSKIWISSSSKPISEIQIFDLSGRSLIQKKTGNDIQQVEININQLQSGVYIVQTVCGDERSSEKLVVSK